MLTTRTPEAHQWALEQFKTFSSGGQFIPFSIDKQTVVLPGFDGGAEWGGPAVDPRSGVIYINANDYAWTGGLVENSGGSPGTVIYQTQCAICHGGDRAGNPPAFPSLVNIDKRLTPAQIADVIHNGKGRMPGFPNLQDVRLNQLLDFMSHAGSGGPSLASTSATGGTEAVGGKLYAKNCAICHGDDRFGAPSNYPGLLGVRSRLEDAQIAETIHSGKGRMPGFPKLTPADTAAILRFLGPPMESVSAPAGAGSTRELADDAPFTSATPKYRFTGYRKFLDPEGYPAVAPPWGTLNAVDLNTGKYLWKIPLGNYPELAARGMADTGTENYGGPIVTAGGVLFIGATVFDRKLRAFDAKTGKLLWQGDLPFPGNATPSTYMIDGKQYIVIATSGSRDQKGPQGAAYVAFALP
jgi:mono/diheme cytochrome c family protein